MERLEGKNVARPVIQKQISLILEEKVRIEEEMKLELNPKEDRSLVQDSFVIIAVIDTRATIHVTPNKSFFPSYEAESFGTVKMGNEDMCQIVGRGDIILSSNVGCQLILKDVKHVPDIRLNLISVGKLDDDGFESHYGNGNWKLTKGNLALARGVKEGSLYHTSDKEIPGKVWSGQKASYNHLKVFGCQAFVHIPKDKRAKLDAKTKQCIYL
ncbi:Retrovirus-related Pol polyprotein from transposon TNT 1-94 [Sesamum alatum]|uniref:Retrovirus-related Pol polyprotein from transposon TNT 1-94 n=1 Tax=Sesamum alatum TaxID=300844 RepID=A0AAE2CIQ5_9LAMI|nr:Retrovirus-related Pol polyprotein from transposon TNT 1-94 [Sesamum alatum]